MNLAFDVWKAITLLTILSLETYNIDSKILLN